MFSSRFINVLDEDGGGEDLGRALRAVISRFIRESASGPFTLYVARSCTFSGSFSLSFEGGGLHLTWVFAPGAVVTLVEDARLLLDGDIELTNGQHFRCAATSTLQLLGRLDGVRPEWFGEATSADEALRRAVFILVDRLVERREQVPLLASGSYRLGEPLRIELPSGTTTRVMELSIIGRHPYGDSATPPTFVVDASADSCAAIVAGRGVRLKLRRVGIRSDAPAASEEDALLSFAGTNDDSELDRCSFFVASGSGVRFAASKDGAVVRSFEPTVVYQEPSSSLGRQHMVRELVRVRVRDSWFESLAGADSSCVLVRVEGASPSLRLSLDRCTFVGSVRAMVAAAAGVLIITSCRFDGEVGSERDGATDLLLGASSTLGLAGVLPGPIHLIETHVRSGGLTHLRCDRGGAPGDSSVSITSLRHGFRATSESNSNDAVRWRGPIGSGLVLQGCSIEGRVVLDAPQDRVIILASDLRTREGISSVVGQVQRAQRPLWPLWSAGG